VGTKALLLRYQERLRLHLIAVELWLLYFWTALLAHLLARRQSYMSSLVALGQTFRVLGITPDRQNLHGVMHSSGM
jgi:hypothetical protein